MLDTPDIGKLYFSWFPNWSTWDKLMFYIINDSDYHVMMMDPFIIICALPTVGKKNLSLITDSWILLFETMQKVEYYLKRPLTAMRAPVWFISERVPVISASEGTFSRMQNAGAALYCWLVASWVKGNSVFASSEKPGSRARPEF